MLFALTKLDAVNLILSSVGSDPVDSIDTESDIDVSNAVRLLDTESRNIQRKGWDFNTGTYTFTPDKISQQIYWDSRILSHKATDGNSYIQKDGYLYNATDRTFKFTKDVELEVTMLLEFEELPDCFKNYIARKAAMAFQVRFMGDTSISQFLQMELQEAYQDIVDYDLNMGDYNMLQLTNIAEVLQRT